MAWTNLLTILFYRQKAKEEKLGCKFIRINPDKESFNIHKAINEIFKHIKQ